MQLFFVFILTSLAEILFAEYVRYDSYRIYQVTFNAKQQYRQLLKLIQNDKFEVLHDRQSGSSASVIVPPDVLPIFNDYIAKNNITIKLQVENLQSLIEAERNRISSRKNREFDWEDYHPLKKIYAWQNELQGKYANVKVKTIGESFEGRDIDAIEIFNGKDLPGVVIESGAHAREWITIAGTSWMINEILKSSEPIWKKFNYLYIPCYNPDGYVYSWETDRMWRKTRSVHVSGSKTCYGVDGNRNWDSDWGGLGSSSDPCSQTYRGPYVFSEPETKSISNYLTNNRKNNEIYLSYHSYGQSLKFPYGYTDKKAFHYYIWKKIAEEAGKAYTKVHGKSIKITQMYNPQYFLNGDSRYVISGDSTDWYYEKLNATISFFYEMRDKGLYGFILPPYEIAQAGEEHLASLKVILQEYLNWPGLGFYNSKKI